MFHLGVPIQANILKSKSFSVKNIWKILLVFLTLGTFLSVLSFWLASSIGDCPKGFIPTGFPEHGCIPLPESPSSSSLILYSQLRSAATDDEKETFSDDVLKVQFTYPKKYFSQFFNADPRYQYAGLYFLEDRDDSRVKDVADVVRCEVVDQRKNPTDGPCSEGIIADVEVSIHPVTKVPDNQEEDRTAASDCEKEILSTDKIIYSCSTVLSPNPDNKGMEYNLYILSNNPIVIRILTGKPKQFADVIKGIVESVVVTKNDTL
jgi:hypothetical protein